MSDLDLLKNEGILAINKPSTPLPEKTVVVLGVARGGTTMVASVLQSLGVSMGEKLGSVLEDVVLSQAVESRDKDLLLRLVAQRNEEHSIWGWKRPSAVDYSEVWQDAFRNPYIIAIFRDPFAISNRNRISMLADVFQNMEHSVQTLGRLVTFLKQQKGPLLLCSYEKVLASPEIFVRSVDDFLDLNVPEKWSEAISRINPAPKDYLETSRITRSVGCLDVVNENFCRGWAFFPQQPNRTVKVQIFINAQHLYTVEAKLPRMDVKDRKAHPTGICGFKLEWPEDAPLKNGDRVEARVEGDVRFLEGSPKIFNNAG